MEQRSSRQRVGLEQRDVHRQKVNLTQTLHASQLTHNGSHTKCKTVQLVEDNREEILGDPG